MRRNVTVQLLAWKAQVRRKPLILRGARQVGKTWSVVDFGKQHFPGAVHVVDLEKHPEWHAVFAGDLGAKELCYWDRAAKSSSAEVDFLVVVAGRICPVEVKSGPSGRLRSLRLLLDTHANCPTGYVFSGAPYAALPDQKLLFLPLYYAGALHPHPTPM
ncbi:MAG: hypothetical protein NTW21_38770 [Verrucomicrobia bacterium]|nr:hypothetical protein [Verrucomicrobiota bacterium]